MTKDLKKKIIEIVAKEHHILIDENDPIFALVTANELALNDYVKRFEQAQSLNLISLENQYEKIIADTKILAERKIGVAVEKVKIDLDQTRIKTLKDIDLHIQDIISIESPDKNQNNKFFYILIFAVIVALLTGLSIGILLQG